MQHGRVGASENINWLTALSQHRDMRTDKGSLKSNLRNHTALDILCVSEEDAERGEIGRGGRHGCLDGDLNVRHIPPIRSRRAGVRIRP